MPPSQIVPQNGSVNVVKTLVAANKSDTGSLAASIVIAMGWESCPEKDTTGSAVMSRAMAWSDDIFAVNSDSAMIPMRREPDLKPMLSPISPPTKQARPIG